MKEYEDTCEDEPFFLHDLSAWGMHCVWGGSCRWERFRWCWKEWNGQAWFSGYQPRHFKHFKQFGCFWLNNWTFNLKFFKAPGTRQLQPSGNRREAWTHHDPPGAWTSNGGHIPRLNESSSWLTTAVMPPHFTKPCWHQLTSMIFSWGIEMNDIYQIDWHLLPNMSQHYLPSQVHCWRLSLMMRLASGTFGILAQFGMWPWAKGLDNEGLSF